MCAVEGVNDMSESVLVGRGKHISKIPRAAWEEGLSQAPERIAERLRFMSEAHRLVRNFVVRELPHAGGPISVESISLQLGLPLPRTSEILEDLERHLFFLVRNPMGEVSWAFPVTADDTGHHLIFSTGERLDAA
jgi:hypothetical protein